MREKKENEMEKKMTEPGKKRKCARNKKIKK